MKSAIKLTITFSKYVYDKYILGQQIINKSKFIESMFVKGITAALGHESDYETRLLNALTEIRTKEEKISTLGKELALVKARVMTQEKRQKEKEEKQSKMYRYEGLGNY